MSLRALSLVAAASILACQSALAFAAAPAIRCAAAANETAGTPIRLSSPEILSGHVAAVGSFAPANEYPYLTLLFPASDGGFVAVAFEHVVPPAPDGSWTNLYRGRIARHDKQGAELVHSNDIFVDMRDFDFVLTRKRGTFDLSVDTIDFDDTRSRQSAVLKTSDADAADMQVQCRSGEFRISNLNQIVAVPSQ